MGHDVVEKTDLKAADFKKQTQSSNSESQSLVSETLWFAEEDTIWKIE